MPTPESSLEALANRVAKLEVQNRRLKQTGIALFIVAAAVVAMGQAPAKKVITANEFVLQDQSGPTRARLSMELKERQTLSFYKDKSNITASLDGGDEPDMSARLPFKGFMNGEVCGQQRGYRWPSRNPRQTRCHCGSC
jgi:hypothetical protein